jgi:hypothetical protein
MARRRARPSIRMRLWPWAPPSSVSSQSGLGQGEIFSKAVNPVEAVAMGAAIWGKLTIRIRARRSLPVNNPDQGKGRSLPVHNPDQGKGRSLARRRARPSVRTRLWPWALPSRVVSKSGLRQGNVRQDAQQDRQSG